jgi:hypothetical protein
MSGPDQGFGSSRLQTIGDWRMAGESGVGSVVLLNVAGVEVGAAQAFELSRLPFCPLAGAQNRKKPRTGRAVKVK